MKFSPYSSTSVMADSFTSNGISSEVTKPSGVFTSVNVYFPASTPKAVYAVALSSASGFSDTKVPVSTVIFLPFSASTTIFLVTVVKVSYVLFPTFCVR